MLTVRNPISFEKELREGGRKSNKELAKKLFFY